MVLFFEKNIVDFKSFWLGQEYNIYISLFAKLKISWTGDDVSRDKKKYITILSSVKEIHESMYKLISK